jgi:hypothetical protein
MIDFHRDEVVETCGALELRLAGAQAPLMAPSASAPSPAGS